MGGLLLLLTGLSGGLFASLFERTLALDTLRVLDTLRKHDTLRTSGESLIGEVVGSVNIVDDCIFENGVGA